MGVTKGEDPSVAAQRIVPLRISLSPVVHAIVVSRDMTKPLTIRRTALWASGLLAALVGASTAGAPVASAAGSPGPGAIPAAERWGVTAAPPGISFGNLSCPSIKFCAATVDNARAGHNAIATSTDLGLSWTAHAIPSAVTGGANDLISCGSSNNCVSDASNPNTQYSDILSSTNGAQTWTDEGSLSQFELAVDQSISCGDAEHCLYSWTDEENPGAPAQIEATSTGGRTWTITGSPDPVSANGLNAALFCRNALDCFAATQPGDYGSVLISGTTNGGKSWTALGGELSNMIAAGGISCPTATNCLVAGQDVAGPGIIASTSNGGRNWVYGRLPAQTGPVFDASCASASSCWATAAATSVPGDRAGVILFSADGGLTWTLQFKTSQQLGRIACFAPGTCLAVGHSEVARLLAAPATTAVPTADGKGYYVAAADGTVWAFGDAHFYGDMTGQTLSAPIVGIAADPSTGGYWLVAGDGGVFAFHAPFYGSTGLHLRAPVVGIAAMPAGDGYRLVASDGGIFDFGPGAHFYGSMGGTHLKAPMVAMADDGATGGYWLIAADGGVFAFHAPYLGSAGSAQLRAPIVGVAALPSGTGYRLVGAGGKLFDFGAAAFGGSLAGQGITSPVIGLATAAGSGCWIVQANGLVSNFGGAPTLGSA